MQKALIGILALATAALGVLYAMQSKQLREARQQARTAEEARTYVAENQEAHATRLAELERTNKQLEEQVQKFAVVTTSLRTNEARQSSDLTALAQRMQAAQKGAPGEEGEGLFGKGMGDMLGKMMKDPGMREMIRAQQKAMMDMMYGGLFKDLKLSPEEKDKLKELLTDAQMKNVEAAQGMFGGEDAAKEDTKKQMADAKKQSDAQIKALLGDERFAQYESYQKNMSERMQIDQFRNQMAGDMALSDEQAAQLMQVMKDAKTALPPPIPNDQTQMPDKDMFTADKLERQLQWMDDYNKQLVAGARQVLSTEQLNKYQAFLEQQKSMQEMGLKMAKQMFGGEKSGLRPAAK